MKRNLISKAQRALLTLSPKSTLTSSLKGKRLGLNIGELLTPLGLAYLLCDDGTFNKTSKHRVLCTDSYTIKEVDLLVNVLNTKWNLKCYKNKYGSGYRTPAGQEDRSI